MKRIILIIMLIMLALPASAQAHSLQAWQCHGLAYQRAGNGERYAWKQRCIAYRRGHAEAHHRAAVAARCAAISARASRFECVELGRSRMPLSWTVDRSYHELIRRESGWNPRAVNPSSGACGLHQFLPCRAFGSVREQGDAGYRYIRERYGSPAAALRFHHRNGWY